MPSYSGRMALLASALASRCCRDYQSTETTLTNMPAEPLTDQQLRDCIIEAVRDGDATDALHYAQRWNALRNPFPAAQWCAACGKWTDHTSGTCPTIAH